MSDHVFDQNALPTDPMEDQSTTKQAAEEAKSVARDAGESGKAVASTAKDEAQQVASEAKYHAQDLYQQARSEVSSQAATQQQRAAGMLHALTGDLNQMAQSNQGGMASGLVGQVADQAQRVAGWLESREPADLLEDVKRYARRNPGNFLAACALVGFVGGRLTRNLASQGEDHDDRYAARPRPIATVRPAAVTPRHIESVAPAYGGPPAPPVREPIVTPPPTTEPLIAPTDPGAIVPATQPGTPGQEHR